MRGEPGDKGGKCATLVLRFGAMAHRHNILRQRFVASVCTRLTRSLSLVLCILSGKRFGSAQNCYLPSMHGTSYSGAFVVFRNSIKLGTEHDTIAYHVDLRIIFLEVRTSTQNTYIHIYIATYPHMIPIQTSSRYSGETSPWSGR